LGEGLAYLLSLQVFCAFVLLNLVIAVILENFSSTAAESQSIITPDNTAQATPNPNPNPSPNPNPTPTLLLLTI